MPHVTANGIKTHYRIAGPESAPAVIFAHSVACSLDIFDHQFFALADRYRVVRFDFRGHGLSAPSDQPIAMADLAADLAALMDALKIERAHVVGLSIGGMAAQALALAAPARVRSLTLMATTPYFPTVEFWTNRAALVRASGMGAIADMMMPRWFSEGFRQSSPDAVGAVRNTLLAADAATYARCCEAIGAMDLRDHIGAISAPTLILVGAGDPATPPAMAEDMRQRIKGAEMVVIPDAAHIISMDKAAAVTAHLSAFLARHGDGATPTSDAFQRGLAIRKSVLGGEYVDASLAKAGDFGMPWQDFITRVAWNDIWGDATLPRKTRSLLTLAMMVALHREEEFKLHVRPALANGVSIAEMRAMVLQAAVYAGIPAGNAAIRWMRDVLGDELRNSGDS